MTAIAGETEFLAGAPHGLAQQSIRSLHHDACKIPARDARQRGVRRFAQHVGHVAGVEACREDSHQYFVWGRFRSRAIDQFEFVELAKCIDL